MHLRSLTSSLLCIALFGCQFVLEHPTTDSASDAVSGADGALPPPGTPEGAATPVVTLVPEAREAQPAVPPHTGTARVAAIAVGGAHACALSDQGEVACWGANDSGQLGYAHPWNIGDDEPAADAGLVDVGGTVVALVAGERHTCALLDTNRIRCWGFGEELALGRGNGHPQTIGDDETPAEVGDAIVYASAPFEALAAGDHHSCTLTTAGRVKCWGTSPVGALGYGYATRTGGWLGEVPLGETPAIAIEAGCDHTCALFQGGAVRCWGQAPALGYGGSEDIGDDEAPTDVGVLDLGEPIVQLAAGHRHTCALTAQGAVRCWGMGGFGALGTGSTYSAPFAAEAAVVPVGEVVTRIAAGHRHTCALTVSGAVRCWGDGAHGALGYGNTLTVGDDEPPAQAGAVQLGESAVQIDAGDGFTCALLQSGAVRCWGLGLGGRLGNGSEEDIGDDEVPADKSPIAVFGP